MNTVFYRDRIVFKAYPYALSSVTEQPEVRADSIQEIRLDRFPPEILLKSGEILFIERRERQSLGIFAEINHIPVFERLDVWALICEPFVETELTAEDHRRTMHQLADAGFLAPEVLTIRQKIKSKMLAYNSSVSEWVNLSHMDVLNGFNFNEKLPFFLVRKAKKRFYDWTHQISGRAPVDGLPHFDVMEKLRAKLLDIAYSFPRVEKDASDPSSTDLDPDQQAAIIRDHLAEVILPAYGAERRHYPTNRHLLQVLDALEVFDLTKEDGLALKLAALFHDVISDTTRYDNEEESIKVMRECVGAYAPPDTIALAETLILITKDHTKASTFLEKCMADADLLVLAQSDEEYDRFSNDLRNAYGHVAGEHWRPGRLEFLLHIEAQAKKTGRIYANFHPMHEQQALLNIRREMGRLQYLMG